MKATIHFWPDAQRCLGCIYTSEIIISASDTTAVICSACSESPTDCKIRTTFEKED